MNNIVKVANISISNDLPFVLVAGPCQIETLDHALFVAEQIKKITNKLGISFIYKSSFDKANRTSAKAQRGTSIDEGLSILAKVKSKDIKSATNKISPIYFELNFILIKK